MNVLLLTYGTRGDVQPFVALGKGLQKAGHHVTLATSERFTEFAQEHGLPFMPLTDEFLAIIDSDAGKDLMENGSNIFQMAKRGIKLAKQLKPAQHKLLSQSWEVAQETKPDLIVFHQKIAAAPHIAEKMDIPCAMATLIPMFVPTAEQPFLMAPKLKLGGWFNKLGYKLVHMASNKTLGPPVKQFREEIGLPPFKNYHFLKKSDGRDIPVIHAHSEAVVPRPSDWPDSAFISGYWFLEQSQNWEPPQKLVDFLNAGEPPVYIGFGSMGSKDPQALADIVVNALKQANLRGILVTGWGGLKAENLPDTVLQMDNVPHDWLLPQVSAVVHHGGAGTTAGALRAGKPNIVVSFFGDQPFWGQIVHDLGAGPDYIPRKKLTSASLANALKEATTNQSMKNAAAEIGANIKAEDGVKVAVDYLETLTRP